MLQQILALMRKDFKIWLQRPVQLFVLFVVPLLFIWVMGAVFGDRGDSVRVAVFVVNQDEGRAGLQVLRLLSESDSFEVLELETLAEASERVGRGDLMAAVIIPADFSTQLKSEEGALMQVIVDPARAQRASIVTGLLQSALASFIVDAEVSRGVERGVQDSIGEWGEGMDQQQAALFQELITLGIKGVVSGQVQQALDDPLVRVELMPLQGGERTRPPTLMESLVPGYSLMFLFFLVPSLAITLLEERQIGTLRRLLTAPTRRATLLAGKILPFFLISLAQFIFVLAFGRLAFGVSLGNQPLALALLVVCAALCVVGLGILIGAVAKSLGQADGLTMVIVLVMAVVSGSMFPSIRIPVLEYFTPHYWAILGFQNVVTRGLGLEGVWLPAVLLLAMAVLFFGLGVWRFRFEE